MLATQKFNLSRLKLMQRTAHPALIILLTISAVFFLSQRARADFNSAVVSYDLGKFYSARNDFLALAEIGHAGAEFMLGVMRFYGKGVPPDDAMAAIWFYKAAIKGNPNGQLAFGSLHIRGLGLRQDLVKAYGWLSVAANQAIPGLQQQAIALRDEAARLMNTDEIADAMQWASRFKARSTGLTLEYSGD